MQQEHGTGFREGERENFFINPLPSNSSHHVLLSRSGNDSSQPAVDLDANLAVYQVAADDPLSDTQSNCTSVSRIDIVCTEAHQTLVSQCTDEVLNHGSDSVDSEDTLEGIQEDSGKKRTAKKVFILHFDDKSNIDNTNPILQLALCLRQHHVDVILDIFEHDNPPSNWPLWYEESIRESEVVLCVITKYFHQKLTRGNHVIGQSVYSLMNDSDTAFRAVFLNTPKCMEYVPPSMRSSTSYCLYSQQLTFENKDFASLYAFLTGQNRAEKPKLGEMVVLHYNSYFYDQKRQDDEDFHPYTREQLDAIYAANASLLASNSLDSVYMFSSEGGGEADADIIDAEVCGSSNSESSDEELVAEEKIANQIGRSDINLKGLVRGSEFSECILPHRNLKTEQERQSNIMHFPGTLKHSGTRHFRDNYHHSYNDKRLSVSQYSASSRSSGVYPVSRQSSDGLLLYSDVQTKLSHKNSDFDLSEQLLYPREDSYIPQSSSRPNHDVGQRSSFASCCYPVSCSSSQTELALPRPSLSIRQPEPDTQSITSDSSDDSYTIRAQSFHQPSMPIVDSQSFRKPPMPIMDKASRRVCSRHSPCQKQNLDFHHSASDSHRPPSKILCSYCGSVLVCPLQCDIQVSGAVAPPKEVKLGDLSSPLRAVELPEPDSSSSSSSDSDSSQYPLLKTGSASTQPTLPTAAMPNRRSRRHKWKCVIM